MRRASSDLLLLTGRRRGATDRGRSLRRVWARWRRVTSGRRGRAPTRRRATSGDTTTWRMRTTATPWSGEKHRQQFCDPSLFHEAPCWLWGDIVHAWFDFWFQRYIYCLLVFIVSNKPSVLWRCWFGSRKVIRPVKNWVVVCWRGYLSGARCRLAYGPANGTATHCLLLQ